MESAGRFTAVPGAGMVLIGATALVAAYLSRRFDIGSQRWLELWMAEALVAMDYPRAPIEAVAWFKSG